MRNLLEHRYSLKWMGKIQEEKQKRDWAGGVPVHMMDSILDRLHDLSDYIRFASVCVRWRSVALDDRNRKHHNKVRIASTTQIPLLMFGGPGSGVFSDGGEENARFYSVTRAKVLDNFNIPSPYKTYRHIIGSAFGWLINIEDQSSDDDDNNKIGVTLFNPFSSSVICLPPISIPGVSFRHFDYFKDIVKATLSKNPALYPQDYVVLIICGDNSSELVCIKPGDDGPLWRKFGIPERGFWDVIHSKSRGGLFLGVLPLGQVCSVDITAAENNVFDIFTPPLKTHKKRREYCMRYIVETPAGDLLQVFRIAATPFRTLRFAVFKLQADNTWCELSSLGDMALFVGDGSSLCVTASSFRGCRPGSIYFSLPNRCYYKITHYEYAKAALTDKPCDEDWLQSDIGVVDVNATAIGHLLGLKFDKGPRNWCSMVDKNVHARPIWVVPTFQDQRRPRKEEEVVVDVVPTIQNQPREDPKIEGGIMQMA